MVVSEAVVSAPAGRLCVSCYGDDCDCMNFYECGDGDDGDLSIAVYSGGLRLLIYFLYLMIML
jgi:hypothetical protein